MGDSIESRYGAGKSSHGGRRTSPTDEGDDDEDLVCFGWLRGIRERAVMLEIRRKGGGAVVYDYALLRKIEIDPSEGIILHFGSEQVKILGRNLKKEARPGVSLVRGLIWHRVPWVRESSDTEILAIGRMRRR